MCMSTDINECISGSAECHDNAMCSNSDGSNECTCNTGFSGDGINCISEIAILYISSLLPVLLVIIVSNMIMVFILILIHVKL